MPGVAKIGATTRNPSERLAEANASDTWRPPRPYVVACAVEVADPFASEKTVHALLVARRVDKRHEFFEITEIEARVLLSLLAPQSEQPQTHTVSAPPVEAPAPSQIAGEPGCSGPCCRANPPMIAGGATARVGRTQLRTCASSRERQRHQARLSLHRLHDYCSRCACEASRKNSFRQDAQYHLSEHRTLSKLSWNGERPVSPPIESESDLEQLSDC
jgi:hypothetical protein